MLILTLKEDDKILIGDKITVMVVEIRGKQIRLGIEAPAGLLVLREKLAFLKRQYPKVSKKELYNYLSDYLNRLSQREQTSRNLHG